MQANFDGVVLSSYREVAFDIGLSNEMAESIRNQDFQKSMIVFDEKKSYPISKVEIGQNDSYRKGIALSSVILWFKNAEEHREASHIFNNCTSMKIVTQNDKVIRLL